MKYVTIYSPDGDKLEVAEPRAASLLKEGWSLAKGEDKPNAPESVGNGVDALVDAETQSDDEGIPVVFVGDDAEAGPQTNENDNLNYVDTTFGDPAVAPVEDEDKPRKSSRRRSAED